MSLLERYLIVTMAERDSDSQAVRVPPRKRVAEATHFYKIIIHRRPNGMIDTISFLMPHDNKLHPGRDAYILNRAFAALMKSRKELE